MKAPPSRPCDRVSICGPSVVPAPYLTITPDVGQPSREWIGYEGVAQPLFVALHEPVRTLGGVVICGPIGWEVSKDYRRQVMVARRLAASGLAVVRFHYRGLGESPGSFDRLTLQSMEEDAARAARVLSRWTGLQPTGLIGVRLGAFAAAALATKLGGIPLVLWDPIVDGSDYLRELSRVERVWTLTRSAAAAGLLRENGERRSRGVLGYELSDELVAELEVARLEKVVDSRARSLLCLQVGDASASLRAFAQSFKAASREGREAAIESIPGRVDWWLKRRRFETEERSATTLRLVAQTVEWFQSHMPTPVAQSRRIASLSSSAETGGRRSTAAVIAAGPESLVGTFVEPVAGRGDVGALILNCGGYHLACGPLGLWSRLASKLASLGVPSLRLSYRGVADSSGEIDDFDLSRPLVEDMEAARAALAERGFRRQILIGGCLGARTVCAGRLEDVVGLGLVSLPLHVESLARSFGARPRPRRLAVQSPDSGLTWLNHGLIEDLHRCLNAGVPIEVVYAADEPYRRDFDLARSGGLGALIERAGSDFSLRIVDGDDSMFETESVAQAVADFVVRLLQPEADRVPLANRAGEPET
jgi:alpha/beta superfamily hydrolase